MNKTGICLVGGQPVPNLLPLGHLQPSRTILVCSEDTKPVSENLRKVLENKNKMDVSILKLDDPYDIANIKERLEKHILEATQDEEIIFNVTGGTKLMFYAAVRVAQEHKSKVVYLKSEKNKSLLYQYAFEDDELLQLGKPEVINEIITIDDYLKIHIGEYSRRKKDINLFEQTVAEVLKKQVSELEPNISFGTNTELDLVIRFGNQVGVAEVTTARKPGKNKIDQLNSATRREALGTYTKRFFITSHKVEQNNRELAKISGITIIELLSFQDGKLSDKDAKKLGCTIGDMFA